MDDPRKLTVDEVVERIAEVRRLADAGDPDAAHSHERRLHQDVLEAIAQGARLPRILAGHAISTRQINFERWTA